MIIKTLKTPNGVIEHAQHAQSSTVFAKRYVGNFSVEGLANKAATGLWYSGIQGNPHALEGEGSTPLMAFEDAISRTNEKIKLMQLGVKALTSVVTAIRSTEFRDYDAE